MRVSEGKKTTVAAAEATVFVSIRRRALGAGFGYSLTLGANDYRKTRNYEN